MYLAHGGSDFIAILSDWARLAIVKRVVCRWCGGAVLPLADGAQRARVLGHVLEVLVVDVLLVDTVEVEVVDLDVLLVDVLPAIY